VSRASTILAKWRTPDFPTNRRKSDDKCPDPLDLPHLQCCHFAVVFGKFTPHVEFQSISGGIVPKLSEYWKFAEAAEILGVSQGTIRTWAEAGKIPMHKNPANGYRLFLRRDLDSFLETVAKVHPKPR
jgi:excisionase family DNA binding protein